MRPGTLHDRVKDRVKKRLRGREWPEIVAACPSGTFVVGCLYLCDVSLADVSRVAQVDAQRLRQTVKPGTKRRDLPPGRGGYVQGQGVCVMGPEVLGPDEVERLAAVHGLCSGYTPEALAMALEAGCELVGLPRAMGGG